MISERECDACNRGEEIIVTKATAILPSGSVHRPSGMVCSKTIPDDQWNTLLEAKRKRDAARADASRKEGK